MYHTIVTYVLRRMGGRRRVTHAPGRVVTMRAMETGSPTRRDGGTLKSTAVETQNPTLADRPAGGRGRARRSLALAGAALATVAIAACGGSKSSESTAPTGKQLNMHTVIASIEESFLEKRHIHAKITCPTSEEQRQGNNFTCEATGFTGTGTNRKPFTVHVAVTQVNNSGYVKYVSY